MLTLLMLMFFGSFAAPQVHRPFTSLPDMPEVAIQTQPIFHVFHKHVAELIRPRRQTICMELIGQRRWAVWMMTHLRHPRTQTARGVDVAEGGAMSSCGSAAAAGQGVPLGRQPLHLQVVVGLHHQSCSLLGSSRASSNISRRGSRGSRCCNSSSCNSSNSRGQAGVQQMQQQQGLLQQLHQQGPPAMWTLLTGPRPSAPSSSYCCCMMRRSSRCQPGGIH